MNKLQVFLADDHIVLREGLQLLINAQPDMKVVGQASSGLTALEQVQKLRPDVVVMDVSLPDLDGGAATERITQTCPNVRVLALTRYNDVAHLRRLLHAGATGYVLKQSAADELIGAIRKAARGETHVSAVLMERMLENFAGRLAPVDNPAQTLPTLTAREREVLRLIAWGTSNKEIAAQFNLSVKTVEFHKARAMEKLRLRSRTELVRYALLQGWLCAEEAPE